MRFNKYGIVIPNKPKHTGLLPNHNHVMIDELQWHNARDLQQLFNDGNNIELISRVHHNQRVTRRQNDIQKARFNTALLGNRGTGKPFSSQAITAQLRLGNHGTGKPFSSQAITDQLRFSKLNNKFRRQ